MAGYDKQKLVRMLEQRRRANGVIRDLSERRRAVRSEASRLRSSILQHANHRANRSGEVERLLNLPTVEAAALSTDEIQGYDVQVGNVRVIRDTDINAQTYRRFIELRDRAKRFDDELELLAEDFRGRYGIVAPLVSFVKAQGFADPELEVLDE